MFKKSLTGLLALSAVLGCAENVSFAVGSTEDVAATNIQRVFRGHLTRKHLHSAKIATVDDIAGNICQFLDDPGIARFGATCLSVHHNEMRKKEVQKRAEQQEIDALIGPVHEIAGGTYTKGAEAQEEAWDPEIPHPVTVETFGMQENQISQRQYELIMGIGYRTVIQDHVRSLNFPEANFIGANKPIMRLTRAEEDEYITRLNRRLSQLWAIAHPGEVFRPFRKPTDDEREYVTTSPDGTHQEFPVDPLRRHRTWSEGPYDVNSVELHANARGIKGFGNIWEVTSSNYIGDPNSFVLRGGAWLSDPESCRSSSRGSVEFGYRSDFVGLRLVR